MSGFLSVLTDPQVVAVEDRRHAGGTAQVIALPTPPPTGQAAVDESFARPAPTLAGYDDLLEVGR